MDNKICVYAICKNEAKFVDRWYESMKFADHIVVLDTGSTDNTVELLKAHKDIEVHQKIFDPWRFDDARNYSEQLVPDEYNILITTDLDEVFTNDNWAEFIRLNWKEHHTRCMYKYIWAHDESGNPSVVYNYNWCHTKEWTWACPVHEYLVRTTKLNDNESYGFVNFSRDEVLDLSGYVTLEHFPDRSKSRSSYYNLLKIRYQEYMDNRDNLDNYRSRDSLSVFYMGRECWYNKEYENAIEYFSYVIENKDLYERIVAANAAMISGLCYRFLGSNNDAIELYKKSIEIDKEYIEAYIEYGYILMTENKYDEAINIIREGYINGIRKNHWIEDGKYWSYLGLTILGSCYWEKGDKVKAIALTGKALDMVPDNDILKHNFKGCLDSTNPLELI